MNLLTWSGCFDINRLESSIERRCVDDVRVEVTVRLPVDEERHDDGDDQAHDHRDDDAHVQSHVIRAGSSWRKEKKSC